MHKETKDLKVIKDRLVFKDSKVFKEHQDSKGGKDLKVLVELLHQLRDLKVVKDQQDLDL